MISDLLEGAHAGLVDDFFANRSSMPLIVTDHSLEILRCNAGFLKLAELPEPPVGRNLAEFFEADDRDSIAVPDEGSTASVRLVLQAAADSFHILDGFLLNTGERLVLFTERLSLTESALTKKLSGLHERTANLVRELQRKNAELERARQRIRVLQGLLPICAYCHKIRDAAGLWSPIDAYISRHSDAEFSHGICPDCLESMYPEEPKD